VRDFYANLSTGKWPVVVTPIEGATCHSRAIVILPNNVASKDYLDCACHESLHASNPDWDEATVSRTAGDLAEVLWKIGFRLIRK
jgi:hypothetical protein